MTKPHRIAGGFTLVELLVAIAIIALLAGLMIPVQKSARESANASKCLSNMRQIGMALHAYASDKNDEFPPVIISRAGWKYWDMDAIWEYAMGGVRSSSTQNYFTNYKDFIFYCPSSDPAYNCSYAMNVMFPSGVKNLDYPRKRSSIAYPSACLLLGEGRNHAIDSWFYASAGQSVSFPHRNRMNLLFVDLHVESRTAEEIPRGGWGTPESQDSFWTGN